ncbi:MAG: hypothetical protein ACRDRL_25905 [Sciscionella sp.]
MFEDGALLAMDAVIAESYLGFERRKILGKWMWREQRHLGLGDTKQPWLASPPAIVRDSSTDAVRVMDIVGAQLHQTWRLGSMIVRSGPESEAGQGIVYLAELGKLRCLATTPGLACGDVIVRTCGPAVERMRDELVEKH